MPRAASEQPSAPTKAPSRRSIRTQLIPTNLHGFSSSATNVTPQASDRAAAAQRQRGADARPRRHRHQRRWRRPSRRHRHARLAAPPLAQDADHGGRPHRQPGAVARPVGALLGADGAHGKRRGASAAPSSPTAPTTTSASSTRAACRRLVPTRRSISSAIGFTDREGGGCYRGRLSRTAEWQSEESRIAGTYIRVRRPTTSASVLHTPAPTCRAPGTRSACASMTSTAHSAGRASTTISSSRLTHARQRDNYDEQNFLQELELTFASWSSLTRTPAASPVRARRAAFSLLGIARLLYAPGSGLNTLHRRSLARADRAQRLPRRGHDDHQPRLRQVPPPRPLSARSRR